MAFPWVIAHRGASGECPENTMAAFEEAWRQRCDGIELDVQLSRDGIPVVYHDSTLDKAGAGRQRIDQLDLAELRRLDIGLRFDKRFHGEHIPTFEEVLLRHGSRGLLLVEIKAHPAAAARVHVELARAVTELVERTGMQENLLILSFDPGVLDACAATAPRVRRVLNLKPPSRLGGPLESLLPRLFGLSADIRTLTPSFAADVHRAGRLLLAYTCNTPRQVNLALAAGTAGIMSDRPGWLRTTLEQEPASRAT